MRTTRTGLVALALWAGIGAAWIGASPALATQGPTLSVDDLTRTASVVLEGTVLDVQSFWTPPGADGPTIYTNVRISAENVLKGFIPTQTFTLRLLGGTVGTTTMKVVDMPQFAVGEQVVLFLGANLQSPTPTVALKQGKLTVTKDPATGVEIIAEKGWPVEALRTEMQGVIDAEIAEAARAAGLRAADLPLMHTVIRPEDIPARPAPPEAPPADGAAGPAGKAGQP